MGIDLRLRNSVIYGRSPYMCDIVIARNVIAPFVIANPRFAWVKQSSVFKDIDCFVARSAPRNDEPTPRHCEPTVCVGEAIQCF